MTNKELIDYCIMLRKDCIGCPYIRKECDQFIKETECSPWMYFHQIFPSIADNDEEFFKVFKQRGRQKQMTVVDHIKNIVIETIFCIPIVLFIDFVFDKIFDRLDKIFDKIDERHNK